MDKNAGEKETEISAKEKIKVKTITGKIMGNLFFLKDSLRNKIASFLNFMHFLKGGYSVLYTILANYAREEILTILNKWYIITENELIKEDFMKEANIGGLKICYNDEGEGKCVLLLHGWGANKESLNPVFNSLKTTFRVICPDLPGFGESDEPETPWSAKDYADFLKDFIKVLDIEPFAALGHSNGGRILIKASDNFSPEKLILMDSAGIKKKHGPIYYTKVYSYKLGKKILKLPLLNKTGLYESFVKNAGSDDYKNSSPVMRATMSKLLSEDLTHMLPGIKSETLLIWGTLDTATPISDGRKMEKLIKGSGLVEITGGGHFSYLDNPGKALGAISYFLTH